MNGYNKEETAEPSMAGRRGQQTAISRLKFRSRNNFIRYNQTNVPNQQNRFGLLGNSMDEDTTHDYQASPSQAEKVEKPPRLLLTLDMSSELL